MNISIVSRLLLISFGIFFFSGCISFVYKTDSIRTSMAENDNQLQQRSDEIVHDYEKRLSAYNSMVSQLKNRNVEPYTALKKELNVMASKVKSIRGEQVKFHQQRLQVEAALGNEKEIPSSHPGYKAANDLREKSSGIVKRVNQIQGSYAKSAERYNEIAQKAGIVNVRTAEVINQFQSRQKEVEDKIQNFRYQIADAQQKNSNSSSPKSEQRDQLLKKMSAKSDEIEVESKKLFELKDQVVHEAAGRSEFLTGPHLPSYRLVERLNEISKVINHKGDEISRLIEQFKSLSGT